jgi:hypothetical protein
MGSWRCPADLIGPILKSTWLSPSFARVADAVLASPAFTAVEYALKSAARAIVVEDLTPISLASSLTASVSD